MVDTPDDIPGPIERFRLVREYLDKPTDIQWKVLQDKIAPGYEEAKRLLTRGTENGVFDGFPHFKANVKRWLHQFGRAE